MNPALVTLNQATTNWQKEIQMLKGYPISRTDRPICRLCLESIQLRIHQARELVDLILLFTPPLCQVCEVNSSVKLTLSPEDNQPIEMCETCYHKYGE